MNTIDQDWLHDPATQKVCAAIGRDGAQVLFVGGCVRNALLGAPVADLDLATDATPQTVMALAAAAGIKAVPTGIDHGTVTLISGGRPQEVPTFRRDVRTDGRHAEVAYSNTVEEDAARRDFTMNALYARPDGSILDPLGGMTDLLARRVRFIGDADMRLREDHLRSLRYFRFHAWYGDDAAGFDPIALAAIAGNPDGLDQLSRERIGAEMIKLLAAPDPAPSVAAMRSCGVLHRLMPGSDDRALAPLVHLESTADLPPDPLRRLAALGGVDLPDLLRLSRAQATRLDQMQQGVAGTQGPGELGFRLGHDMARDVLLLRAAMLEQPLNQQDLAAASRGANARLPISAQDLMPGYQGAALGRRLTQLTDLWIASDFTLTRTALLAHPE